MVVSEVWMCAPPHRLLAEDHYSAYNGEGNLITKAMLLAEKILGGKRPKKCKEEGCLKKEASGPEQAVFSR